MSSFFTVPASQRKRKRTDGAIAPASKKRNTNTAEAAKAPKNNRSKPQRDESISGSESDDDDVPKKASGSEDAGENSESDHGEETAADRRLRLAERYLENIREEVDEVGFDAADIDRDLIAERLKEDVVCLMGIPTLLLLWLTSWTGGDQRTSISAYSFGSLLPECIIHPISS